MCLHYVLVFSDVSDFIYVIFLIRFFILTLHQKDCCSLFGHRAVEYLALELMLVHCRFGLIYIILQFLAQ